MPRCGIRRRTPRVKCRSPMRCGSRLNGGSGCSASRSPRGSDVTTSGRSRGTAPPSSSTRCGIRGSATRCALTQPGFCDEPVGLTARVATVPARAALAGNPSDGYGGAVLAVAFENRAAWARVAPGDDAAGDARRGPRQRRRDAPAAGDRRAGVRQRDPLGHEHTPLGRPRRLERDRDRRAPRPVRESCDRPRAGRTRSARARGRDRGARDRRRAPGPDRPGVRRRHVHGLRLASSVRAARRRACCRRS